MAELTVYGAPWCPDSRRTKRFLGEARVAFEWVDVAQDPDAAAFVRRQSAGKLTIPKGLSPACLHLVRRELGSEVTNKIARRMVVPPQRDGGQRQYIDQPIPVRCSEGFAPHLDWVLSNLDKPLTVTTLARRVNMSARTFARRFVEETGRTPMQWVTDQRVLYARRLLEETDLDIDRIADKSGFGTATVLGCGLFSCISGSDAADDGIHAGPSVRSASSAIAGSPVS